MTAPQLLGPEEGERAANGVSLMKAALPELTLAEYRWPSGRQGPERHVHHDHSDAFYVLGGSMTMAVGPDADEVKLRAGDFMLVPPGVAHTFTNMAGAEAHFLNFHAPDCGYAESLRGRREGFDQHPIALGEGGPVSEVVLRRSERDERSSEKAGAGHAFALTELLLPPGARQSLTGGRKLGSLYVLEGSLEVSIGDQTAELGPGGCALAPSGRECSFANAGEEPARVLSLAV